jgi:hypothetical protein
MNSVSKLLSPHKRLSVTPKPMAGADIYYYVYNDVNHHLRANHAIVGAENGQYFGSINHPLPTRDVAAFVVVDVSTHIGRFKKACSMHNTHFPRPI